MDLLASTHVDRILAFHRKHFGETEELATRSSWWRMRTLYYCCLLYTYFIQRILFWLPHLMPYLRPSLNFFCPSTHLVFPAYVFNNFFSSDLSSNERREWWKREGRREIESFLKWGADTITKKLSFPFSFCGLVRQGTEPGQCSATTVQMKTQVFWDVTSIEY
jgi:hypothetical protein